MLRVLRMQECCACKFDPAPVHVVLRVSRQTIAEAERRCRGCSAAAIVRAEQLQTRQRIERQHAQHIRSAKAMPALGDDELRERLQALVAALRAARQSGDYADVRPLEEGLQARGVLYAAGLPMISRFWRRGGGVLERHSRKMRMRRASYLLVI